MVGGGVGGGGVGVLLEQVRSERLECNIINNKAFERVELTRAELRFSTFLSKKTDSTFTTSTSWFLQLAVVNRDMVYRFTINRFNR